MPYEIDYLIPTYNIFLNNCFKRLAPRAATLRYWLRNVNKIAKYIETKKNIKTKNTYYCALLAFVKYHKKPTLIKRYSKIIGKLSDKIQKNVADQPIIEDRHIFTEEELTDIREKLRLEYEKDKTNNLNNMRYLIICLYTLQPPNRSAYSNMLFKKINKHNNYVNLSNKTFNIQKDKVSKYMGSSSIKISDKLYDVITDSLLNYPRMYLLTPAKNSDNPIRYKGLYTSLKKIDERLNIDTLRSSFITTFYKKNPTINERAKVAMMMRHSIATADLHYNKANHIVNFD